MQIKNFYLQTTNCMINDAQLNFYFCIPPICITTEEMNFEQHLILTERSVLVIIFELQTIIQNRNTPRRNCPNNYYQLAVAYTSNIRTKRQNRVSNSDLHGEDDEILALKLGEHREEVGAKEAGNMGAHKLVEASRGGG